MTDYTAEIAELLAAYQANRVANASIATEVKSKYRAIIAEEIRVRKAETDKKFADHLARVKARSDMPLGVIQDHVLHTKAWDRWVYWRDLANIAPERISVTNAKEAARVAASPFIWDHEAKTLTVKRNSRGDVLDPVIIYDYTTARKRNKLWMAESNDEDYELLVLKADEDYAYLKMVSNELSRAIDAKEIVL